jgi:hypothetical protein
MSFTNIDDVRRRIEEQRNRRLNEEQRRAVRSILENPLLEDGFLLPIVDGPPGTGKTTVGAYACVHGILEGIMRGVLYIAPTNFAAQQAKLAFENLGVAPRDVVWLNPRAREKDWERGIVGVRWDLSDLGPNSIRRLRNIPVIICTPYMLGRIKRGEFRSSNTKILIDEFSQVDPAIFFMVLSKTGANVDRYVRGGYALLGDPLQLPVVTTQEELMENIVEFIRARRAIEGGLNTLTLQYRMHEEICNAVNRMRQELSPWHDFARLQPSSDVRDRDLEGRGYRYAEERVPQGLCLRREELKEILDPSYTYVVLNSDRLLGDNREERTRSGSLRNIAEAEAAIDIAVAAHESYQAQGEGLAPTIISPYSAQVYEIRERLRTRHPSYYNILGNRVITAYSSQGREYRMVILSLVRNNPRRRIGFLEDEKLRAQVYVACSRAQAKLVVLMSKSTFGGKPLYEELVNTSTSQHALILGWD